MVDKWALSKLPKVDTTERVMNETDIISGVVIDIGDGIQLMLDRATLVAMLAAVDRKEGESR